VVASKKLDVGEQFTSYFIPDHEGLAKGDSIASVLRTFRATPLGFKRSPLQPLDRKFAKLAKRQVNLTSHYPQARGDHVASIPRTDPRLLMRPLNSRFREHKKALTSGVVINKGEIATLGSEVKCAFWLLSA